MEYENLNTDFEREYHGSPELPTFLMMPSAAVKLGFDCAVVLGIIYAYSKGSMSVCKLKNQTIADMLGKSKETIKRVLSELDKSGFIKIHIEKNANGTFRVITIPDGIYLQVGGGSNLTPRGVKNDLPEGGKMTLHKNSKENSKEEQDIYMAFLSFLNAEIGREFRETKSHAAFKKRLSEGYTLDDFKKAVAAAKNDPYHKNENYKYITPEFLTRADKLDKFINQHGNKQNNAAGRVPLTVADVFGPPKTV